MNYPLISEYIEAIKSAENDFEELTHLRPVLGEDGQPVMTSGNFAVVFKMKDEQTGKLYAVKCFTKEQEGLAEAYHQIAEELKDVDSPYLVSIRYLEKELFVDTNQTDETEFPVLQMDWVEGKTLDKYLRENLDDKYALEMLAYRFSQLAQWLIPQPFAHGDLKPDNILVREDGTLVLVDYDGMYVPAMKGQKARELGSPDFRHPLRTENDFDEHIDDFPIICISLSLKALSVKTYLLNEVSNNNGLLLATNDYLDIANSKIIKALCNLTGDTDYYRLLGSFFVCIANKSFSDISHKLFDIQKPKHINSNYGYYIDPRDGYTYKTIKIGNQTWLAENLRYLPQIGNGYYVYNYHGNNVSEAKETHNYIDFGVLYDIHAAMEACPSGWHIPSDEEWKELERYLGMPEKEIEKSINYIWYDPFRGSNQGSNLLCNDAPVKDGKLKENKTTDYGFNAILSGWRTYFEDFEGLHEIGKWWSTGSIIHESKVSPPYESNFEVAKESIFYRELSYIESGIGIGMCSELCCLSVRCIKNDPLPLPKMPQKEKIKELFMQVVKDPYYNYLAIINCLIDETIRPQWIPLEIGTNLSIECALKGIFIVEYTYSQNGEESSFITKCNINNIDDIVDLSYELFNRLGIVSYFISNGPKAISYINRHNLLNKRLNDQVFPF